MISLFIVIWQFPAKWISGILVSQAGCRVILQQASGTIWRGSAALAFSEANASSGNCREPVSVTERFHWATACNLSKLSCQTEIQYIALDKPQLIVWEIGKIQIAANEVKVPANVLEGLGNPWSSLRPRGQLDARWTDMVLEGIGNSRASDQQNIRSGVIRIIIGNLSSPISQVKPLGAYEIQANIGNDGLNWVLSSTAGPLLLKGQGDMKLGLHFEGEASASPEAQDSLIGLLALLGKKEGGIYRLKF
jgi:general secretion pathway protein N